MLYIFDLITSVGTKPLTNVIAVLHTKKNKIRLFEASRKISMKARLLGRKKRAEKAKDMKITKLRI